MSVVSFPGPGQDGEQPPPGVPARDGDDFDMDAPPRGAVRGCQGAEDAAGLPGWRLEQPEPGIMKWRAPSGRVYTTTPTVYDL
jgi:hypothetical protein